MEHTSRYVVGAHEIGEMLGVTRQRANQIAREKGFPEPYDRLHMGNVWKRSAVEAWAQKAGRPLTRKPPSGRD